MDIEIPREVKAFLVKVGVVGTVILFVVTGGLWLWAKLIFGLLAHPGDAQRNINNTGQVMVYEVQNQVPTWVSLLTDPGIVIFSYAVALLLVVAWEAGLIAALFERLGGGGSY